MEHDSSPAGRRSVRRPIAHGDAGAFGKSRSIVAAILVHALASGCASRPPPPSEPRDPAFDVPAETAPAPDTEGLVYETELTGVEDRALLALLRNSAKLVELTERPPATRAALDRRARDDLETFDKVLRSEGYYAAKLDYEIDARTPPAKVRIEIAPGPRFFVDDVAVVYPEAAVAGEDLPAELADLGLSPGEPARSRYVIEVQRKFVETLRHRGYPFSRVTERRVRVDHARNAMSVTLSVDPGPRARFGPVAIAGARGVEDDYIRGFVPWEEGERYDDRKVERLRDRLLATGLFGTVVIERAGRLDEDGRLALTVRVAERKHRSVGLGVSYATDEGFGFRVLWEHRNLLGRQERFTLSAEIADIRQEIQASFRKPRFRRDDQSLIADGAFGNQDTDAFEGPLSTGFAGLERALSRAWTVTGGIAGELSDLTDAGGRREFALIGLSLRGARDTRDDALDPSRGTQLRLRFEPYYGVGERETSFSTLSALGTAYRAPFPSPRLTLAGRAKLGTVIAESLADLPANHRFYSGGGGSIRGYKFQSAGPLSETGQPLGGRSLVELGLALRARLSERLGAAVFVEGGRAYADSVPDLSENLQWAAGLGARYFTPVGPLRLDFGFPLNPREAVDDDFQFYISIGQAF